MTQPETWQAKTWGRLPSPGARVRVVLGVYRGMGGTVMELGFSSYKIQVALDGGGIATVPHHWVEVAR